LPFSFFCRVIPDTNELTGIGRDQDYEEMRKL